MFEWFSQNLHVNLLVCFLLGLMFAAIIFLGARSKTIWAWVDLIWIFVGGFSAATALLSNLYLNEIEQTKREIDFFRSGSQMIAFETEIFLESRCNARKIDEVLPNVRFSYRSACSRVALLAQSTQLNLTAFSVLEVGQPLSNASTRSLDPAAYIALAEIDFDGQLIDKLAEIKNLATALERDTSATGLSMWQNLDLSSKFVIVVDDESSLSDLRLFGFYDDFVAEFMALNRLAQVSLENLDGSKQNWDELSLKLAPLGLRNVALMLLAFVFPLRLGR